jgi:hypothetical protein
MTGNVVAVHVRHDLEGGDKRFEWRRPDGTAGLNGTPVTKLPLYGSERLAAFPARRAVVVEGEKCADALNGIGILAAATVTGAATIPGPEVLEPLRGRAKVVLWSDGDPGGRAHMQRIGEVLTDQLGIPTHMAEWPEGDAADFIAAGACKDKVIELLKAAKPFASAADSPAETLPAGVEIAGRARLYDLSRYSRAEEAAGIDWLIDDFIVRGQIHLPVGPEKRGKTTQALHRLAAVSTGRPYLGALPARLGRGVLFTEMDEHLVLQLIEEDAIEMDWSRFRIVFTNEYSLEERLNVITDVAQGWKPDYFVLDPLDECFGLDGDSIFNPSRAGAPFDLLRTLARTGMAIEGLYHVNNAGRVANSYKFRSKPDHIYEMRGDDASDIQLRYYGRSRAIPCLRRVTGNGHDGYRIETLVPGQKGAGRPAETAGRVLAIVRGSSTPVGPQAVAKATGLSEEASRAALQRLVAAGTVARVDRGLYVLSSEPALDLVGEIDAEVL